jgi:hypothetical protein
MTYSPFTPTVQFTTLPILLSDWSSAIPISKKTGWDTRGARRGQINRLLRGNEDDTWRKA